jgi:hypothetical protein
MPTPRRAGDAQSITAVVIFWAVIGGLGASLLLPAMQSLIHGNFQCGRLHARPDLRGARHASQPAEIIRAADGMVMA